MPTLITIYHALARQQSALIDQRIRDTLLYGARSLPYYSHLPRNHPYKPSVVRRTPIHFLPGKEALALYTLGIPIEVAPLHSTTETAYVVSHHAYLSLHITPTSTLITTLHDTQSPRIKHAYATLGPQCSLADLIAKSREFPPKETP